MGYGRSPHGGRLNDTAAVVAEGINPPHCKPAPFGGNLAHGRSADQAVGHGNPGQFRRETGAGPEGMKGAKDELDKC